MKSLVAATLALSMLAVPAIAAPYDGHPNNPPPRHDNAGPNWNKPQPPQQQSRPQYNYDGRRYDAFRGQAWKAPKGYTNHRNFQRGQKLPSAYRNRSYVVDYRSYHLQRPPRGYTWVRVSNSVFLVSQSNGLISQIVLNLFY